MIAILRNQITSPIQRCWDRADHPDSFSSSWRWDPFQPADCAAPVHAADGTPLFRERHWGAQQRVRIPEVLRMPRAARSAAGNTGRGTGPGALCG